MVAASDNNFIHSVQPAFGPCNLADPSATPLTFPNIGDQLSEKGISWGAYQEDFGVCSAYNPLHDPFQYFRSTYKLTRDYSEFSSDVSAGKLPSVVFVFPNSRDNMHPGYGPMTNGITFLGHAGKDVAGILFLEHYGRRGCLGYRRWLVRPRSSTNGRLARAKRARSITGDFATCEAALRFP